MAGLAYVQLIQEEAYVQNLPELYVPERVHVPLVFIQKQVPDQLVQVATTIQLAQGARHIYLQAVEQVHCQLPQVEGRVTS